MVDLRYMPDRDQLGLAAEIEPAIVGMLPIARLHAGGVGESNAIWAELNALGIVSAGAGEDLGGGGLSVVEQALIAMSLGRVLVSPGVIATLAVYGQALDHAGDATPKVTVGLVDVDRHIIWIDEPGATVMLVRDDDDRLALYPVPTATREADDRTWGVRLLAGVVASPLVRLDADSRQRARLLFAAALAGIAASTRDMAVDYAKLREQFGRPIGSFQAIKHHCADMAIAAREAGDILQFAAVAKADGRAEAPQLIECAFLTAAIAAIGNAGRNIQVHGGIGFIAEADAHLFLKRARLLVALEGGLDAATERVAACGRYDENGR